MSTPHLIGTRSAVWRLVRPRHGWVLTLAAAVLAGLCFGHFIKPHGDFFEFRESGQALWHGELPQTLKRAPLYGFVLVGLGRIMAPFQPARPADQVAAEIISALAFVMNVLLTWRLARKWSRSSAAWVAAGLMTVPVALYCAAHAIVEGPLTAALLATILAAQRGSRWSYVFAAAATLLRYDAAGAIPAVMLVDWLRGRRSRALVGGFLAALPMLGWLALTAATWADRSQDHYLAQIAQAPRFDWSWSLAAPFQALFPADHFAIPVWAPAFFQNVPTLVRALLVAAAVGGALRLVRRRNLSALAAIVIFTTYAGVHSVFPFQFERFAYPLIPLVLAFAAAGFAAFAAVLSRRPIGRGCQIAIAAVLAALLVLFATSQPPLPRAASLILVVFLLTPMLLLFLTPRRAHERLWPFMGVSTLLLLSIFQAAAAVRLLGDGREMIDLVHSARWIAQNSAPEQRVLSAVPGLLRLYAGNGPASRFPGFAEINSADWPHIVAECAANRIRFILWYDDVFAEIGDYYAKQQRLERFLPLSAEKPPPGVHEVVIFHERNRVQVFAVDALEAGALPASAPPGG